MAGVLHGFSSYLRDLSTAGNTRRRSWQQAGRLRSWPRCVQDNAPCGRGTGSSGSWEHDLERAAGLTNLKDGLGCGGGAATPYLDPSADTKRAWPVATVGQVRQAPPSRSFPPVSGPDM